jgi:hypothetical protein
MIIQRGFEKSQIRRPEARESRSVHRFSHDHDQRSGHVVDAVSVFAARLVEQSVLEDSVPVAEGLQMRVVHGGGHQAARAAPRRAASARY